LNPEVSSPPLPFPSLSLSLPFSSLRAPSLSPLRACPYPWRRSPCSPLPLRGGLPRRRPPPPLPPRPRRDPALAPLRGGAPPRPGSPARRRPSPSRPPARRRPPSPWPRLGARPLPLPAAASPAPRRGSLPPARPLPQRAAPAPARGVLALGVACVALAWPRAPPFTPNAFPRAQPHARGDYSWFLVNFKLR
jgi:hypothetical protein